jgi:hypothetical protein
MKSAATGLELFQKYVAADVSRRQSKSTRTISLKTCRQSHEYASGFLLTALA